MISYQALNDCCHEELPNWLIYLSFVIVMFLFCLFLLIRFLPYEECLVIEAYSKDNNSLNIVIPSKKEIEITKVKYIKIQKQMYQIERFEIIRNQPINGMFYTEVMVYLVEKEGLISNHYYEVNFILSSSTWWNHLQKYIKEVFL